MIILFSDHLQAFTEHPFRVISYWKKKCLVSLSSLLHFANKVTVSSKRRLMYYQRDREREREGRTEENERASHLTIFPFRSLGHRCSYPPPSFQNALHLRRTSPLLFSSQFLPTVCHSDLFVLVRHPDLSFFLSLSLSHYVFALLHCGHFIQLPVHNVATVWHLGTIELWQL